MTPAAGLGAVFSVETATTSVDADQLLQAFGDAFGGAQ